MGKLISKKYLPPFLMLLLLLAFVPGCASQHTFASPDLAVTSLIDSLRTNNDKQLREILGPSADSLLFSGDKVADQNGTDKFLKAYDDKHELAPDGDDRVTLVVGNNDWPMPIPIVKDPQKNGWRFDTAAGMDEIINRRIGHNELDAIQTCLAIVDAEREYAMKDPDHDGLPAYAQKFFSDPGHKNGLYWPTAEGEEPSPLGPLVADAESQGYTSSHDASGQHAPYRGYHFRILKSQGPNASGGARDYIVNGEMIGGFAVVAYPAEHGNSGIMTFIVNQDGIVYQRDLGPDTAKIASQMTAFDPGSDWTKAEPTEPAQQ
jgi:hypothetical protein